MGFPKKVLTRQYYPRIQPIVALFFLRQGFVPLGFPDKVLTRQSTQVRDEYPRGSVVKLSTLVRCVDMHLAKGGGGGNSWWCQVFGIKQLVY